MNILAIDTSCDETSVAICKDDWIVSNKLASQIEIHKKWGGVVPGIAKRMHQENIDHVLQDALKQVQFKLEDIDVFAVTKGPGLAIALEVGIKKAQELALHFNKPLVAVNHMEGHIYSVFAKNSKGKGLEKYSFPLLALLVSGKHTEIVLMKNHGEYEVLGKTLDDAVGEAYDKVARMLEFGYPGGQMIELLAREGDPAKYPFPIPMIKTSSLEMSYSGLKTAVLYFLNREVKPKRDDLSKEEYVQMVKDIAASFQKSIIESLLFKMKHALALDACKEVQDIIIAGGVSVNLALRSSFRKRFGKKYRIYAPSGKKLHGDNAGMIGVAAYYNALRGNFVQSEGLDRDPNLSL